MKVTIKEWNAVASWRWNMPEDEVCGICRVQFDGTCPTCKFPGDDCPLCMSRRYTSWRPDVLEADCALVLVLQCLENAVILSTWFVVASVFSFLFGARLI